MSGAGRKEGGRTAPGHTLVTLVCRRWMWMIELGQAAAVSNWAHMRGETKHSCEWWMGEEVQTAATDD